ncbi:hypothetical protein [Arcobacter peruensis]|uniref:hypothetical protein n=1 Tax=Arcobacter peruensis TaxID=2320140 RepID=UPI000F08B48A|nr:hypothetical protein [Arcobacter peruensis]
MRFNDLDLNTKKQLNTQLVDYAKSIGGMNFFLQMIEDIREEKPSSLLNKTAIYHYKHGKITWGKSIYKDTLTLLFSAMRKEEKDGDMLNGLSPKAYKETMNMMRALKPVTISVTSNDDESAHGFTFNILDSSEAKKTKIDLIFKIIYFYNIEFAKDALTFKA